MSDKNTVDLFRGLLSDIEDDDVKALRLGLQPSVAQQQVPQVQIPMAPPAPQQFIPEIQMAPPVGAGQMNIPQPTTPPTAPLPNSDNFALRPPKQVVLGETAQSFPESYTSAGYFPEVPQLDDNVPQVTEPTVEREPSFFDNMRAPRPSYLVSGFEEDVSSQETLDKTYEFANWVKDNPVEAAAAGVSLYPAARIGSAVTSGAAKVVGKLSNYTRGKLPKRFRDFFGNTKTVTGKSTTTKVQREGQPGVYDPLKTTKEVFTVSPIKTGATGAGLYAGSEAGEALFPDIPEPEGSNIPVVEPVVDPSLLRPDGTTKSTKGFLGPIEGNDNSLRTELSIGVNFGNGEVLIPSMIPGLTPEEIEVLRNLPEGSLPPQSIIDKAKAHAEKRIANNLSPFYQDGEEDLVEQDAVEAETTIPDPVKTDADALVKGAGPAPKKDAPPEEKEGFLKKLWGGMKDMFKEGMEDPAFRKTLFAYVGSKALGYDGVTFAGQVLENEWKVQAAERKQEFELEKIYGKEGLATIKAEKKAKTIDPSKVATIYDKETETNLTGAFSADGTMVRLDNAGFYESLGIEPDANGVYPVLPVANVRAAQGGSRFSVGVGLTGNDVISGIRDNIDLDVDNAINTYVSNQGLESAEEKQLTAKLNAAINGTVRNGAARAFKSFYPAGTDFSDFNLQEVSTNAVQKYIQSVARGMEGNSKNLAAFMEKERLKVETEYSVSPSFFKVVGDDSEDAIGGESWSKATAKVKYLASAFGKEIGANKAVPKVAMWSNLERLYNKQSEEMGPEFKTFWESESEDSADKKGQGASPALLWVMSMDRNKSATSSKYFAGSMQDVINKMK